MHTIYIDILIFTNMFQDFLLLWLLKRILHLKCKFTRLICGSLVGGITSLIALLPQMNFIFNILIKIIVAVLLVLVATGYSGKRIFIKKVSTLFIISFLINGGIIMFYLAVKPDGIAIINDTVYFNISPVLLIILTFVIYLILFCYRKLFRNQSKNYETEVLTITHKGKQYIIKCKIDSGCIVKEPFSGSYVIIIEENQLKDIDVDESKMRVIPFSSLGGCGIIRGFRAEKIRIGTQIINQEVYIGMCKDIFKNEIRGLIPKALLEESE